MLVPDRDHEKVNNRPGQKCDQRHNPTHNIQMFMSHFGLFRPGLVFVGLELVSGIVHLFALKILDYSDFGTLYNIFVFFFQNSDGLRRSKMRWSETTYSSCGVVNQTSCHE